MKKQMIRLAAAFLCLCILIIPGFESNATELMVTTMMETLDKVNVRAEASTDAEVLGKLEAGERIFAVELIEDGWYKVVYQGETGYIKSEFLKIYGAAEWDAPSVAEESGPSGEIVDPQEEIIKASEEAARKESEAIAELESIEASRAAAAEAARAEKAERERHSKKVTIGVFVGAVLLIAVYGAVTIIKEMKNPSEKESDEGDTLEDVELPSATEKFVEEEQIQFVDLDR